jgi:SnoaL-like domain
MADNTLSDRAEIHDVIMRYYRGVDRFDLDLIRACFHADAAIDFPSFFTGDIDEFMTYLQSDESLGGFARTMHFAGNVLIEIDGDRAFTETYVIAHHVTRPEHPWSGCFVVVHLRYVDRFERRDARWAVADRAVAFDWVRKEPTEEWLELPPRGVGRRDRTDIVYVRPQSVAT